MCLDVTFSTPERMLPCALLPCVLCCAVCRAVQLKLDALPPTATYHRGASTDEEAEQTDFKKPHVVHS